VGLPDPLGEETGGQVGNRLAVLCLGVCGASTIFRTSRPSRLIQYCVSQPGLKGRRDRQDLREGVQQMQRPPWLWTVHVRTRVCVCGEHHDVALFCVNAGSVSVNAGSAPLIKEAFCERQPFSFFSPYSIIIHINHQSPLFSLSPSLDNTLVSGTTQLDTEMP
jgi:hypothetical protein